jgi:ketosteroid isomerase-like protein
MRLAATFAVLVATGCARSDMVMAPREPSPPPTDSTADGFSVNVYRNVVRGKVIHAFERLSEQDASAALDLMAEDVHYWFSGHHALGGERVSKAGVERWFGRLFRLFKSHFVLKSVEVAGWPWDSTVVTVFDDHVTPPFGEAYVNPCVQVTRLRWGKAVAIRTYVDTGRIEAVLGELAAHGIEEAAAPPILE